MNLKRKKKTIILGAKKKTKFLKKPKNTKEEKENEDKQQRKINFKDISTKEGEDFIAWCLQAELLKKPSYCKNCRSKTGKINTFRLIKNEEYLDKFVWKCKDKNCRNSQTLRANNKFLSSFPHIEIKILLIYVFAHFCYLVPASTSNKTLGICFKTIQRISDFLRKRIVIEQKLDEIFQGKLGGKGKVVEIDESCFFRRKANKGRLLKQIWGFGIVERQSGRLFVQLVEKRNAKELTSIIQKWISKNSSYVISDEWKSYSKLKSINFNHVNVNHSKNFVNPINPEIHTQTIENRWGQSKP